MVKVGHYVEFTGSDSQSGVVVALFTKLDNESVRCVVQDSRGLLLIKNPKFAKIIYTDHPISQATGDGEKQ